VPRHCPVPMALLHLVGTPGTLHAFREGTAFPGAHPLEYWGAEAVIRFKVRQQCACFFGRHEKQFLIW